MPTYLVKNPEIPRRVFLSGIDFFSTSTSISKSASPVTGDEASLKLETIEEKEELASLVLGGFDSSSAIACNGDGDGGLWTKCNCLVNGLYANCIFSRSVSKGTPVIWTCS